MRKWYSSPAAVVARLVYGPNPANLLAVDASFGADMRGQHSGAGARSNPDSPYTARANGDLGPLQRFTATNLYGQANSGLRINPTSLPNTTGDANPMIRTLFNAGI